MNIKLIILGILGFIVLCAGLIKIRSAYKAMYVMNNRDKLVNEWHKINDKICGTPEIFGIPNNIVGADHIEQEKLIKERYKLNKLLNILYPEIEDRFHPETPDLEGANKKISEQFIGAIILLIAGFVMWFIAGFLTCIKFSWL